MIAWKCKYFSDLSNWELYKILQLRNEIFVVEQNCVYQDCDGKDLKAYHYMGWQNDELVAYSRLFEKGIIYTDAASIGRVITAQSIRRQNAGRQLMHHSINEIYLLFGEVSIRVEAQFYLKNFYESFGFVQTSEVYLEDGIEHISMSLPI
jgi:ElaA protein